MSTNLITDKETTVLSKDMDKETIAFAEAMNMEPEPTATAIPFAEATDIEPTTIETQGATGHFYRVALYHDSTFMGYIGQDSKGWAKLADQGKALILEWFPHNGVNYYRIRGTDRFLSVSDRAYVGFYSWSGATGFTQVGSHLRSDYNHQDLSYDAKENRYLTCWNTYKRMNVRFVQVR